MSAVAFYSATGKWYRTAKGRVYPSAGMICTKLTGEHYDFVGIESLERAMHLGEGTHRVACDYSMMVLGHLTSVELPPMPAECPLTTSDEWNASMEHALLQVTQLFKIYEVEPIAVEEPSVCSLHGFGGQPDIKLTMTWRGRRIIAVWDYKRVASLTDSHRLKIECYKLLDGYQDCRAGFIAWLTRDGPAQLKHIPLNAHDRAAICGHAAALNWQIANGKLRP